MLCLHTLPLSQLFLLLISISLSLSQYSSATALSSHNFTLTQLPASNNLTIIQLNVYLRPPFIHTGPAGDFKRIRFEKLKNLFEQQLAHVWVLAECFEPWASRVIDAAHNAGYPYVRQGPSSWANWQKPVGSGVMIISKYPLENTEKVTFKDAAPFTAD